MWLKKSKVLDYIVDLSSCFKEAASLFQTIVNDWSQLSEGGAKMEKIEHDADDLVITISYDIERTFILPIDKEDAKELTHALDDLVDGLDRVVNRLNIYAIPSSNKTLKAFSELVLRASDCIHRATSMLREHRVFSDEFAQCCKEVHSIEEETDRLYRGTLKGLMRDPMSEFGVDDFLSVLKWREIIDALEGVIDRCEDAIVLFERVRVKYK